MLKERPQNTSRGGLCRPTPGRRGPQFSERMALQEKGPCVLWGRMGGHVPRGQGTGLGGGGGKCRAGGGVAGASECGGIGTRPRHAVRVRSPAPREQSEGWPQADGGRWGVVPCGASRGQLVWRHHLPSARPQHREACRMHPCTPGPSRVPWATPSRTGHSHPPWVSAAHTHTRTPAATEGDPRPHAPGREKRRQKEASARNASPEGRPRPSPRYFGHVFGDIKGTERGLVSAVDQEPPAPPAAAAEGSQAGRPLPSKNSELPLWGPGPFCFSKLSGCHSNFFFFYFVITCQPPQREPGLIKGPASAGRPACW